MTNDALQYIFALQMPHLMATFPMGSLMPHYPEDDEWAGWGKYYPDED